MKILIVQRRLTHYRVPFFEALRDELAARDIGLELLVGQGTAAEQKKKDTGDLMWATHLPTRYFANGRLCWQPVYRHVGSADLVVVTQENALLANHWMLLRPRNFKLAFWGHGANLQSPNPDRITERYKRWMTRRVDWWFAYTRISADLVTAAGFPADRVTVLNNAVDSSNMRRQRSTVTANEIAILRQVLGFGEGAVAVFVGSLHADKRLDFLLAAADAIRLQVAGFQLLLVGDGPEREMVQAWCNPRPWAHWAGARFGRDKVVHLALAEVMLNPGMVGLGLLDAFACGVPLLTTDCGIHSPEIAYLENGRNGVITANAIEDYVEAAVRLLRYPATLSRLRVGCAASAAEYTVENMVRRFADGVESSFTMP